MLKTNTHIFLIINCLSFLVFTPLQQQSEPQIISIYISIDKEIWLEEERLTGEAVQSKVKTIVTTVPFETNKKTTFMIFADERLTLDFIMTVEQEMLKAYSANVKRERYLLHQVIRDLDGFNRTKNKYIKQSFNNK